MKLAIHKGSSTFHDRWIAYCINNSISYKLVDCHSNDLISNLKDCHALMWHFHQGNIRDNLIAKQIIFALSHVNFVVFPDFRTSWHFNDKLGQKYLFEAIGAPFVPTYIFYKKNEALRWAEQTIFPKVFKLRVGASSENVNIVKTKAECLKIIRIAFSKGFAKYNVINNIKDRFLKFGRTNFSIFDLLKGFLRLAYPPIYSRLGSRERGYVYFQDFIDNNEFDIRVVVIGSRAFALKRFNRPNDFRASGSGNFSYEKEIFDIRCIKIAFEIAKKLELQMVAFDFIFNQLGSPLIVEISYGFVSEVYDPCVGYWDDKLNWHEGFTVKEDWMVELVLEQCRR